mgnify:CR=1 FL=1
METNGKLLETKWKINGTLMEIIVQLMETIMGKYFEHQWKTDGN